jgi:hypothetical protein
MSYLTDHSRRPSPRWLRPTILVFLALPLLAAGPCLTTATESLITGFFNAVTNVLVQQLQTDLGLLLNTA